MINKGNPVEPDIEIDFDDVLDLTTSLSPPHKSGMHVEKNKVFGKLNKQHKMIDLFSYKKKSGFSKLRAGTLMSKAIDCHVNKNT